MNTMQYNERTYIEHALGHVGVCNGEVGLTDRLQIQTYITYAT